MSAYVALLRAVNVGGTGKLPMTELRDLCEKCGFDCVRTYIQSGNVVFKSALAEAKVKAKLEKVLAAKMGKPTAALVRTGEELQAVIECNPFPGAAPNQVLVLFLDLAPKRSLFVGLPIPGREKIEVAGREVFIHYPDGMGQSKLKVPLVKEGTGRNLNTIRKLASMAEELEA